MADTDGRRDRQRLEKAADETQEPAAASRARADEDAATRGRQAAAAAGLREAAVVLGENQSLLRETGGELRAREQELARTGELAQEVAQDATGLRAHTSHTVQQAAKVAAPEPKADDGRGLPADRED